MGRVGLMDALLFRGLVDYGLVFFHGSMDRNPGRCSSRGGV